MNEEEQEVIKRLETKISFWEINNIKDSDERIILNLISKLQKELDKKDKAINGHIRDKKELSERMINTLKQIEFKDKEIDLILKYMLDNLLYEDDLDNIYEQLYNKNGMERPFTRGDETELKMLKEYFYKQVEEENE